MPEDKSLPVLPVRDTVLFPHAVLPLTVGRESSVQLINSLGEDKTIIVIAQREARVDAPQPTDLYTVGSLAVVHKVVKMPNQSLFVFAEGLERVRLTEFTQLTPFMRARVETVPESIPPKSSEVEALQRNVLTLFQQIVAGSPTLWDELSTVAKKIVQAGMPDEVKKEALKELGRLSRMSPMAADYSVTRNYIEWLAVLPWNKTSGREIEIPKAKEILDTDHYDLQKVKDRILDYLSVRRLKPTMKGPILCFVGPPGVGKTSLGKSIARALGRKFVRISLGGVHDEAEIRGHRRTYIGALPGQIIQGIRRAETKDPVFMLDEI